MQNDQKVKASKIPYVIALFAKNTMIIKEIQILVSNEDLVYVQMNPLEYNVQIIIFSIIGSRSFWTTRAISIANVLLSRQSLSNG